MNRLLFPLSSAALWLTGPLLALAGSNPDFERDAKPILDQQPGLAQYVHAHFVVKETGIARVPGTPDQPPQPPFIFNARPRGTSGPFYVRLLIQPGPEGHILKVADVRRLPGAVPEPAPAPEPDEAAQAPAPASRVIGAASAQTPAPAAASTSQPSADTPTGPIRD